MSDMKPVGYKVEINGKEYSLLFTLNAMDDIQEKYEIPIAEIGSLFNDELKALSALRYILTILINEGMVFDAEQRGEELPKPIDERQLGRMIHTGNMHQLMTSIMKAVSTSMPEVDEDANPPTASELK